MGLITLSIVQVLLVGCAGVSDDIARVLTKQGSNVTDDAARQFSKNRTALVPVTSKNGNQNELLKQCTQEAKESAVREAGQRLISSDNQASDSYLLAVARDAIQRCTVGKVGDQLLDELANLAVSDYKQEQLSRQ
jgi:hypothetical protein